MTPTLAPRGRYIVLSAGLMVLAGAIHADAWPLVALGAVIVSAVGTAYLWFFPAAILLRRRKVEMAWWVPPGDQPGGALTVDHPFGVHVALRNHGGRLMRVLEVDILASSALETPRGLEAKIPAATEVEVVATVRARASGHWALHGAVVTLGDLLGLFELSAYFPNPISLKVFPRQFSPRAERAMLRTEVGALHERLGVHHIRRRGLQGDLREIREHTAGDPFKMIAWKPTARRRRLMVRELENEIVVTHHLLVDMGATMRGGSHGRTKLDYAIETAAALARVTLEGGDRVGLTTFDTRVYGHLKPGEGRPHYLKVVDRLLETRNVVDEDLTEITDAELVAIVARYLAHQEAVDVRLRVAPPAHDPRWTRIAAGPAGELYDMSALGQIVGALLKVHGAAKHRAPAWWWSRVVIGEGSDPELARLRLFCRLRGIELPYRQPPFGRRALGFVEALSRATTGERSQFVVILSDLEGVLEDPPTALRAVALARRRHQQLVAVAPFAPAFAPRAESLTGWRVATVLSLDERRRLDAARALLAPLGVPVLVAGPDDTAAILARRMRTKGTVFRSTHL